jgi:hypothetical protein
MPKITWTFQLEDGNHTVELYHSPTSGQRAIQVDGAVIAETKPNLLELTGNNQFVIGTHTGTTEITTNTWWGTFAYELTVDGHKIPPVAPGTSPVNVAALTAGRPDPATSPVSVAAPTAGTPDAGRVLISGSDRERKEAPDPQAQEAVKQALIARAQSNANWLFAIAGLTLLNWIFTALHIRLSFYLGLAICQALDTLTAGRGGMLPFYVGVLNLFLIGLFTAMGLDARNLKSWAFLVGIGLYAVDSLIFAALLVLLFQNGMLGPNEGRTGALIYFGVGWHLIALYGLYQGLDAYRKVQQIEQPEDSADYSGPPFMPT